MQGGEGPISMINGKYLFLRIQSQVFTKNLRIVPPVFPLSAFVERGLGGESCKTSSL